MKKFRLPGRITLAAAVAVTLIWAISLAEPAYAAAAPSVPAIIDNLRNWAMGILAALATLFLTIGGIKYLIAGGNPRAVEEAKGAIRSAVIGYVLAALAPLLFSIVKQIVGG
ncbi:MAG: pilin [Candidatus Dormibacteria bacterium]